MELSIRTKVLWSEWQMASKCMHFRLKLNVFTEEIVQTTMFQCVPIASENWNCYFLNTIPIQCTQTKVEQQNAFISIQQQKNYNRSNTLLISNTDSKRSKKNLKRRHCKKSTAVPPLIPFSSCSLFVTDFQSIVIFWYRLQ